jgi:hypothetical protein
VSNEIREYRRSASGDKISKGRYAVDPSGNVCLVPDRSPIKTGWRVATQADIDACKSGKPVAVEAAPPAPVAAEPKLVGRKSLSTKESDAIPSDSPRVKRSDD